MVEEKKKRGRPKKIVTTDSPRAIGVGEPWRPSGEQLRNDLVISMVMGIINKAGTIKYDFAKDLFNTATQLAYDFGWMEKPKEKKPTNVFGPQIGELPGIPEPLFLDEPPRRSEIITPADAFRAVRGDS